MFFSLRGFIFKRYVLLFCNYLSITFFLMYHTIDLSPFRKSTDVTVVNKYVSFDFSGVAVIFVGLFFWKIFVYCVELATTLPAPLNSFVKKSAFTDAP